MESSSDLTKLLKEYPSEGKILSSLGEWPKDRLEVKMVRYHLEADKAGQENIDKCIIYKTNF